MPQTAAPPARTTLLSLWTGGVRGVVFGRARKVLSAPKRRLPRYRGVLALLALVVATMGPPLGTAAGWNVEGLKRRPRMEVRAPAVGSSTLRRASQTRRAGPAGVPWSHASVLNVATATALPTSATPTVRRDTGFRPPSLASPPSPSRAPPFA